MFARSIESGAWIGWICRSRPPCCCAGWWQASSYRTQRRQFRTARYCPGWLPVCETAAVTGGGRGLSGWFTANRNPVRRQGRSVPHC